MLGLRLLLASQTLLISTLLFLILTATSTLARPPGVKGMASFKHNDLFGAPGSAPLVWGHMKRAQDLKDSKMRYSYDLTGREKLQRVLECQEECMTSYGISSPLWQDCSECCRTAGVAVAYC